MALLNATRWTIEVLYYKKTRCSLQGVFTFHRSCKNQFLHIESARTNGKISRGECLLLLLFSAAGN